LLALPRRQLDEASGRLGRGLELATRVKRTAYERIAGKLSQRGLELLLSRSRDRLLTLDARATSAFTHAVSVTTARLDQAGRLLGSLSYKNVLERGYAVVRDADEALVASASALSGGARFSVELHDGRISGIAGTATAKSGPDRKKPRPKKIPPGKQGDLF